jgi:hypothetical protein
MPIRRQQAIQQPPASACVSAAIRVEHTSMMANDQSSRSRSPARRRARLQWIGILVLVLGLSTAGLVYWQGTRSPNLMDDLSMQGFNRARERQMGMLYGKMGLFTDDLLDDLKQPGTQAKIIAAMSLLASAGCFYFGRLSGNDDEPH